VNQPAEHGGAIAATRSYEEFLDRHPEYRTTLELDELRAREFSRLDERRQIYLDYTGGSLYSSSQVHNHHRFLLDNVLGNPHSTNPTSRAATDTIEACRRQVLEFFNGSPDEYAVIFTANASQALKLVGEAYPFAPGDRFLLTFDNHNSVNGIREFHRVKGTETAYVPVVPPEMLVDEATLDDYLATARPGGHNLFAYPAQSNFSGAQHPLAWIERAQARGWDVLLDAAAYVATNRLDLDRWRPDYVAISFYKMFGYPTGVGVLIARWPALQKLDRPWFAGGTITIASVQADSHVLAAGAAAFEDGTLDYANIPAVATGLGFLTQAGMERIHCRVGCLTSWLIDRLLDLRHGNGRRLVTLYGPRELDRRGATVTFNLCDPVGRLLDHGLIEERAARRQISLRTGCFCNPGAGEVALGLSREELVSCFSQQPDGMTYEEFHTCIDDKETGAVRVSLGIASNFADVHGFLHFAASFLKH
jgi:selenocysteine lyase/cysteine desulfurase